jgi:nitroimidazol reductase NimA-like FMN-containing flavoprotein (pyridoxamine 5'-phosphate oxidase superfamily)
MQAAGRFAITPQTKVQRSPLRASYERAAAHAILDEALVATVAFSENGQTFAIPMAYARLDERILLHAASSSRFARVLSSGTPLCVTVTLLDALVLARSAMHHSVNYRSVVALGVAVELTEREEKLTALARLIEHVLPGRSAACRPPNAVELKATRVFALPLEAVSIKRRCGGPIDDAEDLELPYWAGVVPLGRAENTPTPDAAHPPRAAEPAGLRGYDRAQIAAARASEVES